MQEESTKQKQLAQLLNEEINQIFLILNLNIVDGKFISIYTIKVTPDLMEAKIYLSIYPSDNGELILKKITERSWEVKKRLAEKIKHKVRCIPKIHFFVDTSLDHMYQMAKLFASIEKKENT